MRGTQRRMVVITQRDRDKKEKQEDTEETETVKDIRKDTMG